MSVASSLFLQEKVMKNLSKSSARTLIKGLQRGTIRPGGAKYLHQGHENWISAQLEELEEIEEDGGAIVHFVRGAYGEGKTHFLHYIEELSRDRGWATSHLECRQDNVELDKFETLYPRIIQKIRLFPDVLDKSDESTQDPAGKLLDIWKDNLFKEVGFIKKDVMQPIKAETKLFQLLQERVMRRNLSGNLQRVLCAYPRAVLQEDYNAQNDMISWLRGEENKIYIPSALLSKPGQRVNAPGVSRQLVRPVEIRPITSSTSLDVFRGIIWLLTKCGFKGLILSIDEVEQIARLKYRIRRERSLQTLREFVDNIDGDVGLQHICIYFAATPNMFDDEDYFRSYDALATRIESVSEEINWRAPVIELEKTMLTKSQLELIASSIRWIYGCAYGANVSEKLSDTKISEIVNIVDKSRYRIAKPRLLCRSVVDHLDRLKQKQPLKNTEAFISRAAALLIKEHEE